jgi:hypothetical protein
VKVDIISDKFYSLSEEQNVFETKVYDYDIYISTWDNQEETKRNPDIIVLDLDFSNYTDSDVIPLLQTGRTVIGSWFENLRNAIAAFLEGGGVVIVLLSERTEVAFHNSPDSLGWLDHLGATTLLKHNNPRQSYEVVSTAPEVSEYFEYVDWYRFAVRFEENVVTNPEILAQHSLDNEPLAVAINEYIDPNGIQRNTHGRVVMLPQPTNIGEDFDTFLDTLCGIGEHYIDRRNTANVLDKLDSIAIEDILEKGETEIIEFKRGWPDSASRVAKELVAFANTWGGVLIFGINDEHELVGVEEVDRLKNRVTGVAHQNIAPALDVSIDTRQVEGDNIVLIKVPRGPNQPYSTEEKIYRRKGPTSVAISGSEIAKYYA